jgi:Raf kinase inhibitor-like YbhB/YbcL family protein
MRITTDFDTIPDKYSKRCAPDEKTDGQPIVSFPFYVDQLDPSIQYLHWALTDDDSIPVCGFQWIHWTVANVPIQALMFDIGDANAVQIPPDLSRQMVSMIPEAVQGKNSNASRFVKSTNPLVYQRYTGPNPPDQDHLYQLRVWGTKEPLEGLQNGFWLNQMYRGLNKAGAIQPAWIYLTGRK